MYHWNDFINKTISILNKFKKNETAPLVPFFSKDYYNSPNICFGDYTYGKPCIFQWDEKTKLVVGKFCSIAGEVKIYLGGNHRVDWITTYPFNSLPDYFPELLEIKGHPGTKGDVTIGNDAWLANSCVILSGVSIGDGAVVGANSVVSKNIGAYEVYAGNPAKFIKNRFSDSDISKLLEMKWWDWEIGNIKKVGELLCSEKIDELYDYYSLNIKK